MTGLGTIAAAAAVACAERRMAREILERGDFSTDAFESWLDRLAIYDEVQSFPGEPDQELIDVFAEEIARLRCEIEADVLAREERS